MTTATASAVQRKLDQLDQELQAVLGELAAEQSVDGGGAATAALVDGLAHLHAVCEQLVLRQQEQARAEVEEEVARVQQSLQEQVDQTEQQYASSSGGDGLARR